MGSLINLKKTLHTERDEATAKAKAFMTAAEKEARELTAEERDQVNAHLAEAKRCNDRISALMGDDDLREQLAQFQGQEQEREAQAIGDGEGRGRRRIVSLGQQFVDSQAYRDSIHRKSRKLGWNSEQAELNAALLWGDAASGGDLLVPEYRPGIQPILFQRLTVADLLAQGTTDATSITYMRESSATNAAATVAESAAKPESTLVFDAVTDPVRKIATWLPVSDEMLDDVAALRSYIDERLRLFVRIQEEAQLLNGDGTGSNLVGLRNRANMAADQPRSSDTNADAVHKQITAIMTGSFLMPDGIIMHPTNWQTIALSKSTTGEYLGAGPFNASQQYRLWGLPVVATTAITANTALVGAFRLGAQVFRKGGLTVDATNSHSDYFVRNLTAIRAEERLALAVYRPGAFGEVTGLN